MPEIRIFAERSPHMTSRVYKSKGGDEAEKLAASRVSFVSGRVRSLREQVIMERKTAAFRPPGEVRHICSRYRNSDSNENWMQEGKRLPPQ